MFIVVVGSPITGCKFYGPFKTAKEAYEWCDNIIHDLPDYWVAPLEPCKNA